MGASDRSVKTVNLATDVRSVLLVPRNRDKLREDQDHADVQSAFFGLCIEAGKAVLGARMETERTGLCGPKGSPDASRSAYRGGHTRSHVVLGGRRIGIARPRARAVAAGELTSSLPAVPA